MSDIESDFQRFLHSAAEAVVLTCATTDTMLLIRTSTGMGAFTQPEFELVMNELCDSLTIDEARAAFLKVLKGCVSRLEAKS